MEEILNEEQTGTGTGEETTGEGTPMEEQTGTEGTTTGDETTGEETPTEDDHSWLNEEIPTGETTTPTEQPAETLVETSAEPTGESLYSYDELMAGAYTTFNTKPEVVGAALKINGVTSATVSQAKELIENFLNEEVTD